ncbi:MAG: TetR/AcrR family transcriptional regulator [Propioniciclava sp.]
MPKPQGPVRSEDGYATGRATKQAIVERAAEAFAQRGFHGASLRAIAREAGVDHSTLLHHFGTKTDLLLAVLAWHDEQHLTPVRPAEISADTLIEGLVSTARRNAESPGLVQLLSIMNAEAGAPGHPARAHLQQRHRVLQNLLADAIHRHRRNDIGGAAHLTPEAQAALIIATWDGLQVFDALHPGQIDLAGLLAHTLRGVFASPPAPAGG